MGQNLRTQALILPALAGGGGELSAKSTSHAKNTKISKLHARCVFASEIDSNAKATYALNFPSTRLFGDITQESTQKEIPSDFDILCAGFPCQAFSVAIPPNSLPNDIL